MRGTDQSLCNSRRAFRPLRHPHAIQPALPGKAKPNGVPVHGPVGITGNSNLAKSERSTPRQAVIERSSGHTTIAGHELLLNISCEF